MQIQPYLFDFILLLSQLLLGLFLQLLLQLLSLFSKLLLNLLSLFSKFILQLPSKYALNGLKHILVGIRRLLYCLNRLLLDFSWSINGGSNCNSSFGRLYSLRRLRHLHLFFNKPQFYLFGRSLLCCAFRVILISHWRLVWRRSLSLHGGLISRKRSSKVYRLVDSVPYCSIHSNHTFVQPLAGLPVLQIAWQHDASIRCL